MEITSSYQVEILSNTDMKNTVQIYRRALAFVIDVCNREWGNISVLGGTKEKDHYVENLIHPTKNKPVIAADPILAMAPSSFNAPSIFGANAYISDLFCEANFSSSAIVETRNAAGDNFSLV